MRSRWVRASHFRFVLAPAALSGVIPLVAYSQVYLTEDQATAQIFPGEKLKKKTVTLTKEDIKKIEALSGEKVRNSSLVAWVGPKNQTVLIDQALGKHEFITYAVGITPEKSVKSIEILEYRETYGYQVREEKWRKQFVGKTASSPLKLGKDIVNLSGASLSSAHITGGVKRMLHTYEVVKSRL